MKSKTRKNPAATAAKTPRARRTSLGAAFSKDLTEALEALRTDVDRVGPRRHASASLAAVDATAARLRAGLQHVAKRRCGDLAERLEELDYPLAALRAYFDHASDALPRRATEIMAEYVRDRLLEMRIVARAADLKR